MADEPGRFIPSCPSMTSFVLLPGAGSDSWYWHRVIPLLEAAGHEALAVDLRSTTTRPASTATSRSPSRRSRPGCRPPGPGRRRPVDGRLHRPAAGRAGAGRRARAGGADDRRAPRAARRLVDEHRLEQARRAAEAAGGPPADDWDPERMFLHDVPPEVAAASADHVTEQSDRPSADVWPLDAWPDVPIRSSSAATTASSRSPSSGASCRSGSASSPTSCRRPPPRAARRRARRVPAVVTLGCDEALGWLRPTAVGPLVPDATN